MLPGNFSQRRCIPIFLSLCVVFFFCASYLLWSGEQLRLVSAFQGTNDASEVESSTSVLESTSTTALEIASTSTSAIESTSTRISKTATTSAAPESTSVTTIASEEVILTEYDETPIRELCANSTWNDSDKVIVNCDTRVGGVGNVRQEFLVCVRQAIEIGAALIRPNIMLRSENIIEYQSGPVQNMSYLFDLPLFDARLRSACPQMPLHHDVAAAEKLGKTARVARPWDLPEHEGMRLSFTAWAALNRKPGDTITIIDMPRITGQTPVCLDQTDFVVQFGRLVEFYPPAQRLASRILSALATRFSLPAIPRLGVTDNAFVGLHFRTEVDAMKVGYTSYEEQARAYLTYVSASPIRTIYAASGNTTSLSLFAAEAAKLDPPATVVAKGDMLEGDDKKDLEALTWDQQALVDYLVLEKATRFAGVSDSSFSWGIVYARQVVSKEAKTCESVKMLDKGVQFRDELSTVFGRPRDWHKDKLWP